MKNSVFVLLLLFIWLAGCAPAPQRMADTDRKSIQSVSINEAVVMPPVPFYLGPGGAFGLMFGAIGALATESGRADGRAALVEFAKKNGISIERIVLEEFTLALRASGKVGVVGNGTPGAPSIQINIRQYGLSIPNGFSSNLVPILFVVGSMTDSTGKTVWSASDRVSPLGNPVEGVKPESIQSDPKVLETIWRAAARHVVSNILKEL